MGKVKSGSNFRAIDAASDRETPLNIILHIGRNVLLVDPDEEVLRLTLASLAFFFLLFF